MALYHIPIGNAENNSWDLDESGLMLFEKIENYTDFIADLKKGSGFISQACVSDLIHFFDSCASHWMAPENHFLQKYSNLGLLFLLNFIRKDNLERLLNSSLRGNLNFMDDFLPNQTLGKKIMAQPRGVITHWLAGNVPILGMISLISGIITKNMNVVKLSRKNGLLLPAIAADLFDFQVEFSGGKTISGKEIAASLRFVYCDKEDVDSQKLLSLFSDVRVAWGGHQAVESILSLAKHYGTEDVIFGPKYSFALIGRDSFKKEESEELAYRLALDASVFDQYGCNSPHTVFVEEDGAVSALEFAKEVAKGMERVLKRIPKLGISPEEAHAIVTVRNKYSLQGEVFSSQGTEWTVVYSQEAGLAKPCHSRVLFVRPVKDIYEVIGYIDKYTQTLGLVLDECRKNSFSKAAAAKGVERITDLGKMSMFDYPWDGIFPMDRFVRWVSSSN